MSLIIVYKTYMHQEISITMKCYHTDGIVMFSVAKVVFNGVVHGHYHIYFRLNRHASHMHSKVSEQLMYGKLQRQSCWAPADVQNLA